MSSFTLRAAGATLALLTACASPGGGADAPAATSEAHATHHPEASAAGPGGAVPAMQERMKAMRAMHDKMMHAGTPAERRALMADHMKAMQDGMAMMKGMGAMGGGMGRPAEMAQRLQMMEGRMQMMQLMMEMMMQRLPNPPSSN